MVPRRLRASVQATGARGQHDGLQEHAIVDQRARAHDAIDREDQAHRRVEEAEIAPMLRMHLVLVALVDAQQTIQVPAVFAAPRLVRVDPLRRVVVVLFTVLAGERWIVVLGIVGGTHFLDQAVAARALQHVHAPRLGIAARWRAAGHLQDVVQRLAWHGPRRERPHAIAILDRRIDAGGVIDRCIHLAHRKDSNTLFREGGSGTGRCVARST